MPRAYFPALLLLLWSTWLGTFDGAARASSAFIAHLTLLAVVVLVGHAWRDPLRLGRAGNLLLVGLGLVLILAFYQSPVPRAGRTALILLPSFLLLPSCVRICWRDPADRRRGVLAVGAVVAMVAAWSLVGWLWLETPGTSLPLGHHNLLAAWLVLLLPVVLVPWRDGGASRCLASGTALLVLTALVASRSLSGLVALAVLVAAASWYAKGWKSKSLALALLAALVLTPDVRVRVFEVAAGVDASTLARQGYLEAAWRGFLERPLFGWGPGSVHWTMGRFLEPIPGVHPADQVVADPHSWPLRVLFEIGLLGALLLAAVVGAFSLERWRETPADVGLRRAAFLGLLGFAVIGLAGRPWAAPALPFAAMLVVGMVLAAGPENEKRPSSRRGRPVFAALAMAVLLAPADLAHLAYDRAVAEDDPVRRLTALRRAVELDASFPLYRLRLAVEEGRASTAHTAAEDASGLAHLWLAAGVLARQEGEPWAEEALLEACELNPLGALAPFHLALAADSADARAPVWAGRSLLADPALLAAIELSERGALLDTALSTLGRVEGVDSAWLEALWAAHRDGERSGPVRRLALEMDAERSTALSLHAFRRLPWPVHLDVVRVDAGVLAEIGVGALPRQRETNAGLFGAPGCSLP